MSPEPNALTQFTIMLMGLSFIIGSFTTILALIILDVSKLYRNRQAETQQPADAQGDADANE